MIGFLGKLGFIHRRLWLQSGGYRVALLFGPAPLLGCVVAGLAWTGVQRMQQGAGSAPPPVWAVPQGPATWDSGQASQSVAPGQPLPQMGEDGRLVGFENGWRVTINPVEIGPTMDPDVKPTALSGFALTGNVDIGQIIARGPKTGLYVGIGSGLLAVKAAGVYQLTGRLERPAGRSADCLVRLVFGRRRLVSNFEVNIVDDLPKTYDAVRFDLQPGLYPVSWAFGCWHGQEMTGPGRLTLLVGHPGEPNPVPAQPGEVVRQARPGP